MVLSNFILGERGMLPEAVPPRLKSRHVLLPRSLTRSSQAALCQASPISWLPSQPMNYDMHERLPLSLNR